MARRKLPKIKEEKKPKSKSKVPKSQMDVALLEYVRSNFSTWQSEQVTGVHHTTIQRAWDNLSEAERQSYRERAQSICDIVEQEIVDKEIATVVSEVTAKLKEIGDMALDELRERLKDDLRRMEIKDADLINIITKGIALVKENTQTKDEENAQANQKITQVFNILDQSIQEHLTISSMSYEEQ